jgi:hypothetical protein
MGFSPRHLHQINLEEIIAQYSSFESGNGAVWE